MDPRTNAFILEYRRQRDALLAEFPDLIDDIGVLDDTLEGISLAPDFIASLINDALMDEVTADALARRISEMAERKERFVHRAARRRQAAMSIMTAIEMRKLERPEFTASIKAVPPRVEVYAEELLPDEGCKIERKPDKSKIKEMLASGPVAGARLTNGTETISIRTR